MVLQLRKSGHDPPSIVGNEYNDLTVKRKTTERQHGHVVYECQCICGRMTRVRATRLVNNITKSCGKCQKNAGTITNTIKFKES